MEQMIELMAAPFAACVVLVGIHAYLGTHVIQRKIIFVDLALAQIAALGATCGFLLGLGPHERGAYFFSLAFAVVGAAIFAMTRMRQERVPQEAIIGIVYVVALACAILVADRAPEGAEHIKETLVGTLLWVRWPTVLKTAVIYSLVGALHFALRRRFIQISFAPEQAYAEGRYVRFWDFLFYLTFAFVITSSVAIAGVLVVFSFLVIPAVIASLFTERIALRLALGWSVGIVASLLGMVASYRFDLPSGPSVVASMGMALVLAGLAFTVKSAPKRGAALVRVLASVGIVAGLLAGLAIFFTSATFLQIAHEHDWETPAALDEEHEHGSHLHADAVEACGDDVDCTRARVLAAVEWPEEASQALAEGDALERGWWIDLLAGANDPRARDLLAAAAPGERDPSLRLEMAVALLAAEDRRGAPVAVGLLRDATPPLLRDEAYALLSEAAGRDFGYDAFAAEAENAAALGALREWAEGG